MSATLLRVPETVRACLLEAEQFILLPPAELTRLRQQIILPPSVERHYHGEPILRLWQQLVALRGRRTLGANHAVSTEEKELEAAVKDRLLEVYAEYRRRAEAIIELGWKTEHLMAQRNLKTEEEVRATAAHNLEELQKLQSQRDTLLATLRQLYPDVRINPERIDQALRPDREERLKQEATEELQKEVGADVEAGFKKITTGTLPPARQTETKPAKKAGQRLSTTEQELQTRWRELKALEERRHTLPPEAAGERRALTKKIDRLSRTCAQLLQHLERKQEDVLKRREGNW
ncbi:MAG: hypothetical protein HYV42_03705 [Candidatus Magasanikbacteria bacterium]|nr:hypothetical protein [Candidatus Magasanikbacteria bacterium]